MKHSLLNIVIVLIMSIFIDISVVGQSIIKGPYLIYGGDNTKMEVLWQNDAVSMDTVLWGKNQGFEAGRMAVAEYGTDHQHRMILTGLEPGTKYFYRVLTGMDSQSGSFRTAPPVGVKSLQFFAYGDSRSLPENHSRVAGMINDCWIDQASSQTFVLHMGDLVTNGNSENYWTSDLFNPDYPEIRHMMANLPLMACRGNHEGSAKLFGKYFPYPFIEKYYYSMDYGSVHVTFIDLYTPIKPGSEQYSWLVNDLSRSASPWKFLCLHEPGWSAGGGHANSLLVQDIIEPLCEMYHVDLVFAGHNHYYARAVVKAEKGDSVIHITTGGGGAPLHTPQEGMEKVITSSKSFHFCKINIINDNLLRFEAVSDSAEVIDQFVIDRNVASLPDPQTGKKLEIIPNPLHTNALVEYNLKKHAQVQIALYNMDGEMVREIIPVTWQDAGNYKVKIDGSGLPGGVYVCRMRITEEDGTTETVSRKIVIAR